MILRRKQFAYCNRHGGRSPGRGESPASRRLRGQHQTMSDAGAALFFELMISLQDVSRGSFPLGFDSSRGNLQNLVTRVVLSLSDKQCNDLVAKKNSSLQLFADTVLEQLMSLDALSDLSATIQAIYQDVLLSASPVSASRSSGESASRKEMALRFKERSYSAGAGRSASAELFYNDTSATPGVSHLLQDDSLYGNFSIGPVAADGYSPSSSNGYSLSLGQGLAGHFAASASMDTDSFGRESFVREESDSKLASQWKDTLQESKLYIFRNASSTVLSKFLEYETVKEKAYRERLSNFADAPLSHSMSLPAELVLTEAELRTQNAEFVKNDIKANFRYLPFRQPSDALINFRNDLVQYRDSLLDDHRRKPKAIELLHRFSGFVGRPSRQSALSLCLYVTQELLDDNNYLNRMGAVSDSSRLRGLCLKLFSLLKPCCGFENLEDIKFTNQKPIDKDNSLNPKEKKALDNFSKEIQGHLKAEEENLDKLSLELDQVDHDMRNPISWYNAHARNKPGLASQIQVTLADWYASRGPVFSEPMPYEPSVFQGKVQSLATSLKDLSVKISVANEHSEFLLDLMRLQKEVLTPGMSMAVALQYIAKLSSMPNSILPESFVSGAVSNLYNVLAAELINEHPADAALVKIRQDLAFQAVDGERPSDNAARDALAALKAAFNQPAGLPDKSHIIRLLLEHEKSVSSAEGFFQSAPGFKKTMSNYRALLLDGMIMQAEKSLSLCVKGSYDYFCGKESLFACYYTKCKGTDLTQGQIARFGRPSLPDQPRWLSSGSDDAYALMTDLRFLRKKPSTSEADKQEITAILRLAKAQSTKARLRDILIESEAFKQPLDLGESSEIKQSSKISALLSNHRLKIEDQLASDAKDSNDPDLNLAGRLYTALGPYYKNIQSTFYRWCHWTNSDRLQQSSDLRSACLAVISSAAKSQQEKDSAMDTLLGVLEDLEKLPDGSELGKLVRSALPHAGYLVYRKAKSALSFYKGSLYDTELKETANSRLRAVTNMLAHQDFSEKAVSVERSTSNVGSQTISSQIGDEVLRAISACFDSTAGYEEDFMALIQVACSKRPDSKEALELKKALALRFYLNEGRAPADFDLNKINVSVFKQEFNKALEKNGVWKLLSNLKGFALTDFSDQEKKGVIDEFIVERLKGAFENKFKLLSEEAFFNQFQAAENGSRLSGLIWRAAISVAKLDAEKEDESGVLLDKQANDLRQKKSNLAEALSTGSSLANRLRSNNSKDELLFSMKQKRQKLWLNLLGCHAAALKVDNHSVELLACIENQYSVNSPRKDCLISLLEFLNTSDAVTLLFSAKSHSVQNFKEGLAKHLKSHIERVAGDVKEAFWTDDLISDLDKFCSDWHDALGEVLSKFTLLPQQKENENEYGKGQSDYARYLQLIQLVNKVLALPDERPSLQEANTQFIQKTVAELFDASLMISEDDCRLLVKAPGDKDTSEVRLARQSAALNEKQSKKGPVRMLRTLFRLEPCPDLVQVAIEEQLKECVDKGELAKLNFLCAQKIPQLSQMIKKLVKKRVACLLEKDLHRNEAACVRKLFEMPASDVTKAAYGQFRKQMSALGKGPNPKVKLAHRNVYITYLRAKINGQGIKSVLHLLKVPASQAVVFQALLPFMKSQSVLNQLFGFLVKNKISQDVLNTMLAKTKLPFLKRLQFNAVRTLRLILNPNSNANIWKNNSGAFEHFYAAVGQLRYAESAGGLDEGVQTEVRQRVNALFSFYLQRGAFASLDDAWMGRVEQVLSFLLPEKEQQTLDRLRQLRQDKGNAHQVTGINANCIEQLAHRNYLYLWIGEVIAIRDEASSTSQANYLESLQAQGITGNDRITKRKLLERLRNYMLQHNIESLKELRDSEQDLSDPIKAALTEVGEDQAAEKMVEQSAAMLRGMRMMPYIFEDEQGSIKQLLKGIQYLINYFTDCQPELSAKFKGMLLKLEQYQLGIKGVLADTQNLAHEGDDDDASQVTPAQVNARCAHLFTEKPALKSRFLEVLSTKDSFANKYQGIHSVCESALKAIVKTGLGEATVDLDDAEAKVLGLSAQETDTYSAAKVLDAIVKSLNGDNVKLEHFDACLVAYAKAKQDLQNSQQCFDKVMAYLDYRRENPWAIDEKVCADLESLQDLNDSVLILSNTQKAALVSELECRIQFLQDGWHAVLDDRDAIEAKASASDLSYLKNLANYFYAEIRGLEYFSKQVQSAAGLTDNFELRYQEDRARPKVGDDRFAEIVDLWVAYRFEVTYQNFPRVSPAGLTYKMIEKVHAKEKYDFSGKIKILADPNSLETKINDLYQRREKMFDLEGVVEALSRASTDPDLLRNSNNKVSGFNKKYGLNIIGHRIIYQLNCARTLLSDLRKQYDAVDLYPPSVEAVSLMASLIGGAKEKTLYDNDSQFVNKLLEFYYDDAACSFFKAFDFYNKEKVTLVDRIEHLNRQQSKGKVAALGRAKKDLERVESKLRYSVLQFLDRFLGKIGAKQTGLLALFKQYGGGDYEAQLRKMETYVARVVSIYNNEPEFQLHMLCGCDFEKLYSQEERQVLLEMAVSSSIQLLNPDQNAPQESQEKAKAFLKRLLGRLTFDNMINDHLKGLPEYPRLQVLLQDKIKAFGVKEFLSYDLSKIFTEEDKLREIVDPLYDRLNEAIDNLNSNEANAPKGAIKLKALLGLLEPLMGAPDSQVAQVNFFANSLTKAQKTALFGKLDQTIKGCISFDTLESALSSDATGFAKTLRYPYLFQLGVEGDDGLASLRDRLERIRGYAEVSNFHFSNVAGFAETVALLHVDSSSLHRVMMAELLFDAYDKKYDLLTQSTSTEDQAKRLSVAKDLEFVADYLLKFALIPKRALYTLEQACGADQFFNDRDGDEQLPTSFNKHRQCLARVIVRMRRLLEAKPDGSAKAAEFDDQIQGHLHAMNLAYENEKNPAKPLRQDAYVSLVHNAVNDSVALLENAAQAQRQHHSAMPRMASDADQQAVAASSEEVRGPNNFRSH